MSGFQLIDQSILACNPVLSRQKPATQGGFPESGNDRVFRTWMGERRGLSKGTMFPQCNIGSSAGQWMVVSGIAPIE
jgi:hypothetical protein